MADIGAVQRFELAHSGEEGDASLVIERPGDGHPPTSTDRRVESLPASQDAAQQLLRRGRRPQRAPPDGAVHDGAGAQVDQRRRHVGAADVHHRHHRRPSAPAPGHRTNALTTFTDLAPRGRSR